jgi:lipoyl-dependent peroxiredoxin subunit D
MLKESNLSDEEQQSAKIAATIMAMNNIYYRFIHLSDDKSFATLPAKLRMNAMSNPGVDKISFELMCIAISAINGCGMCINAHIKALETTGLTKLSIQSAIRIAAVLNATATGLASATILD